MRIVFMGTPDFAVPSLEKLIAEGYEICGVFTQPDKPKNRGMKLTPSPVKVCALAHEIPVYQPTSFKKDPEALETLQALAPDLAVVAAYGQILPQSALDVPKLGCINVHSSLLPRYRGAAPINWVILNGETETGVTIMNMALALDEGDILSQVKTPIDPNETVEQLHDRLAVLGAELLGETVPKLAAGSITPIPQDDALSNYAPMLSRALSPIDWTHSAKQIHDQVRGLIPWPAASAVLGETQFKIFQVEETGQETNQKPGTVISTDKKGILVSCGDGKVLRILEVQASGGKRMRAADYLRGHPIL
jgi:methionyl-tRNA formyltransferase